MVKIVRDFLPKPQFLIWCDGSCGMFFTAQFEPPTEEQRAAGLAEKVEGANMKAFIAAAMQQGWKVNLDRQLCPQHVKQESGETSRILIPHGRLTPLNQ